jgi:hypothetical protein
VNSSHLRAFCLGLFCLLGCDFEYRSAMVCSNAGECFRNEICQFDEEGVGQCRLTGAIVADVNQRTDGQITSDSSHIPTDMSTLGRGQRDNDMASVEVAADLGNTVSDMGMSLNLTDGGQMTSDTALEQAADIVCPSGDSLTAVRFECTYPETEQRRNYCQYFVSEVGTSHSCQTFCESIGLFSCDTTADCCWNNQNESTCTPQEQSPLFTCAGAYDSLICRCFETAP